MSSNRAAIGKGRLLRTAVWAALVALLLPFAFASSAQAAVDPSAVYRAVNLNGAAVTVGGVNFEAGTSAPNLTAGPYRFCKQDVTLIPATDAATAEMIRCSVYGSSTSGGTKVTMTAIPSGSYKVSLYVWEDNASTTFSLALNGATVASNIVTGPAGAWKVLGPYTVNITNDSLAVATTGGAVNLSGMVVERAAAAPANRAPVVTGPGNQTSVKGSAISALTVAATDPDAGQTLTYAAEGLPAGLSIAASTGVISGTPTTPTTSGPSNVTVRVTDNGSPAQTGTASFTWTVNDTPPTSSLYRAVNMNGAAVTVGGVAFEAGTSAPNLTAGPYRFCKQDVTLIPATDAATAEMIRCSVYGSSTSGGTKVTMTAIPSGSYKVSLYVWEDNASTTFSLALNGATVASNIVTGPAGAWKVLGPYTVNITNDSLAVATTGGAVNLSGMVVERAAAAPANRAPVVTGPGNQTSVKGSAISALTVAATDPDAGQTLTYAAEGLPAGLSIAASTGVISGTPTTPTTSGPSNVTVRVTDNGSPAQTGTASFTWTVNDTPPTSSLYRAVNLNGAALTVGGIDFEGGTTAPNLTAGPSKFCKQAVPLVPATDEATAEMIRCSVYGLSTAGGGKVTMSGVSAGTYDVSVYVWEDNTSATFSLALNGTTVASNIVSGAAGAWKLLGPYPVTVTSAGTLELTSSGGTANLSGMIVRATGSTKPTSVSVTSPSAGGSLVQPATIAGSVSATAGVDRVRLTIRDASRAMWWNGAAWQAARADVGVTLAQPGAATTAWSYAFNPTGAMGPFDMTATGYSKDGGSSAPVLRQFSVIASGTTPFDQSKVADTFVAGGNWTNSLSADWLGNGHMVVLTQQGLVYDVNPATGAQTQILDIRSKVNGQGEAGVLDIMTDPAGTGFYVYYTVANEDRLRISHFTAGSGTEQVIWTNPGLGYNVTSNGGHLGSSLNIGPDGKLYVSIGDRFLGKSSDLTTVFGKVLRMNLDGTAPTDNPFYDGAGPNVDEIWAYGFRNPFRASFDETTGRYWIGDVGGNAAAQAYEEINIGERGKNYGWSTCEGPLGQPKNGPVCPAGVTAPVYSYAHTTPTGCCLNKAVVGGEVYRSSMFPLAGSYIFADYPTNQFFWLQLGADGRTGTAAGVLQAKSASTPVWLSVAPDGAIYYLSLGYDGTGQLRKLTYSGSTDRPPVISTASASPASGPAPLTVSFTGAASDPDGSPVTYAWNFGDGTSAATANASHTYSKAGSYQATLRVTSNGVTTSSNTIPITVGTPPTAAITAPADGTLFSAGDSLTFTGTGNDPGVGTLPASALSWTIDFLHDDHAHPAASGTGASISYTVPMDGHDHDFNGNTRYRVTLTATDADGLTGTKVITVWPRKTTVKITSNAATSLTVDDVTKNLPFTIDTLLGFHHELAVPATVCVSGTTRQFSSWSDGGARTHTITVTANMSLTATYTNTGTACTGGAATAPLVSPLSEPAPTPSATPTPTASPKPSP